MPAARLSLELTPHRDIGQHERPAPFHMDNDKTGLVEQVRSKPTKLKADKKPVRARQTRAQRRARAKRDKDFTQAVRRVIEIVRPDRALNSHELMQWAYELYKLKKITKRQARLLRAIV